MNHSPLALALTLLVTTLLAPACRSTDALAQELPTALNSQDENAMLVQYLEIVTPDADATCTALEQVHGVSFGEPIPGFGNARTAALDGGGMLGVRAPMAEHETPIVRPYILVDDIASTLSAAEAAGAQIAMPAMEIPGHGQFAIYILGGINHGLWQN
jgi:predicted enzyme related to lactoylglutathione lyase